MIKIIRNAELFSPDICGKKDILIEGKQIGTIADRIRIESSDVEIREIEAEGLYAFPGFIDSHVHVIGGGGEGGFKTRTPELPFSEFVKAGITTVVGCLGTDDVCRNMNNLLAKVRGLEEEGMNAYCYTGSYQIPVKTVTGTPKSDLMLIDKIIGVGEIAISDNRSSQPSYEDFIKMAAEARVGGILSNKSGIVDIHMGVGERGMNYLFRAIKETEITPDQFLPTHVNRNADLFNEALEYVKQGGYIDATTSSDPDFLEEGELSAAKALAIYCKEGLDISHLTFSSDGNGSIPLFNNKHDVIGMGICSIKSLFDEVKNAVKIEKVPLSTALKVITSNTADRLRLNNKGRIEEGKDADIVLVDKNTFEIKTVINGGRILMKDGSVLRFGTFEKV